MTKEKFTKGPWKFNAHDGIITDCTDAKNGIAKINLYDWDYLGMGYKNAHLVAAAPAMYEFIKSLQLDVSKEAEAEDLLARARGENV